MVCQHHRRHLWLKALLLVTTGLLLGPGLPAKGQTQEGAGLVPYRIVQGAIPAPLTRTPGDAARGQGLVLNRDKGDCLVCHALPLPQRQFHGTIGPALDDVGRRYSAGELRLRLVDPKVVNPQSLMPAYYKVAGLHRVLGRYQGQPILTAQEIEDVLAYLLTLRSR